MSVITSSFQPLIPQLSVWFRGLVLPGMLGRYILVVGAAGIGLAAYAFTHPPINQLGVLSALCLLSLAAEWHPIKLKGTPLQGANLSVSLAVAFAALLISGAAGSMLVNMGSALGYCLKEQRPFYKRLFTSSTYMLCSGAAGLAYVLAGGQVPLVLEFRSLFAGGLAAGVYFLVNTTLISGAISLQTGRPFHSILANWQWLFLQMLTSLAIGLVMAVVYINTLESPAFLLVPLCLSFPWYSVHFYVQKCRKILERKEKLLHASVELKQANRALDQRIGTLRVLHDIGVSLNSRQTLPEILKGILVSTKALIGADTVAVFLDKAGGQLEIAGHLGLSHQYLEKPEIALNGSAKRALREGRILVMDKSNYLPSALSDVAAREGVKSVACLPLNLAGKIVGSLDVCFKSEYVFTRDELDLLCILAKQAAVGIHNARLLEQLHENYLSTLRALAATVEAKDTYTRGHSEIVRRLSITIARRLGLSAREIELLNIASLFHDIGKIGISETILHKPQRLDDQEWALMCQHPVIGQDILSKIPALADVHPIVRHHHERYDGKGYPDGVCAEGDILAAIISIADTYQAITSERPYRKAQPKGCAVEEIRRVSGTQLVPRVVEAFLSVVECDDVEQKGYQFDPAWLRSGGKSDQRSYAEVFQSVGLSVASNARFNAN